MADATILKAFAVWFSQLERWDPQSFHKIVWNWPSDLLKPIKSFLEIRKEKVDRTKNKFTDLQPITIHFDGSIDKRKIDGNKEYRMDLFRAYPGDIIVAKIDLKNGAVTIVPKNWVNVVVTSHFAVYKPDLNNIIPQYFHCLIQTPFFKNYLWRNKVGAEGRKEVKLDFFENIKIPRPTLPIQQKIVDYWQKEVGQFQAIQGETEKFRNEKYNELLKYYRLKLIPPTLRKGAFAIEWPDVYRWDTFFYRKDFCNLEKQLNAAKCEDLGNILNFISRPWSKKNFPEGKFEYIEISSVDKEHGITSTKTVNISNAPSRATTLLKKGDIILSTTRPYLGAFAIVSDAYDNCVCTSGFALADGLKSNQVDKEYLLYFLKSDAGLRQMERYMTGGLYPAIVQDELERIKVPIPDLTKQKEFVKKIKEAESKQTLKFKQADTNFAKVKQNIEAAILGQKKVGEI